MSLAARVKLETPADSVKMDKVVQIKNNELCGLSTCWREVLTSCNLFE